MNKIRVIIEPFGPPVELDNDRAYLSREEVDKLYPDKRITSNQQYRLDMLHDDMNDELMKHLDKHGKTKEGRQLWSIYKELVRLSLELKTKDYCKI